MATTSQGGRIALITGGAGGIGREICRGFIERGIVCVLADHNQDALDRATAELGPAAVGVAVDLTDFDKLATLLAFVQARYGRLDILVNNAAITGTGHFEDRPVDNILAELNINLLSPIVLTRLAFAALQRSGDGRVINTVSLGGIFPLPETGVYSATKFGLRGAMLCLGMDRERHGVHVGNVLPSATETPMLMREAVEGGNTLQFMDTPQQPVDVARQVMLMLDRPCLERYPRWSESWSVRLAMLAPNFLPRLIPLFRKKGVRGHARYLESLRKRGLAVSREGKWELS
ncbi:SDR family NAD(P)-dependent oxidoreductase [Duganella violaceipulchra]|uniref:NAD(P)-dependent dehydrogenase (Short-subunit alcohol dehydrogenase family) n=1 Tax=Duganella violaceipulchra TaxID=2849652 RepID=A0AA41HES6_9BURK|nr:SDR family oxidoreductase [Duganella violaceicalia]MBV6324755.1 SDR family oxidoreductase [Duganella violaceicalia]MCP2009078.1 NAD(P)-dependent dehydrogenase (short-subunit alcohol dehydrogenase family) [Duganella violaceicalia]